MAESKPFKLGEKEVENVAKLLRNKEGPVVKYGTLEVARNVKHEIEYFTHKGMIRALDRAALTKKKMMEEGAEKWEEKEKDALIQSLVEEGCIERITQTSARSPPVFKVPKENEQANNSNPYYRWKTEKSHGYFYVSLILAIITGLPICFFIVADKEERSYFCSWSQLLLAAVLSALAVTYFIANVVYSLRGRSFWLLPDLFADHAKGWRPAGVVIAVLLFEEIYFVLMKLAPNYVSFDIAEEWGKWQTGDRLLSNVTQVDFSHWSDYIQFALVAAVLGSATIFITQVVALVVWLVVRIRGHKVWIVPSLLTECRKYKKRKIHKRMAGRRGRVACEEICKWVLTGGALWLLHVLFKLEKAAATHHLQILAGEDASMKVAAAAAAVGGRGVEEVVVHDDL
eukprot:CAMPEP_0113891746 /NCGR_PEP_ID=MMETSP0780_2-20120614/14956_1 /TAXON_ID=652834 /ORGANISM="Palpitomonas bilix" /LENGTH=398 /DNA_ID=CAMNT_0000881455 /DNA_START=112 /DNA_END=1308 /DNA_ORIENTATION=+ /assembly_acc=CAM_ASM_000599